MNNATDRVSSALANRYAIDRELGSGGMATVYRAHDLKHDRTVAVKVMKPELAGSIGAERFLREIQITAQLNHPRVLLLLDSGQADGLLYYVMPYVDGESLRDRLARETQLPIDEALRIAAQVADALQYAHEQNVVHRDIKPENILLKGEHALVADFGIAKALTVAGGKALTQSGIGVGTPAYMSPEQAVGDRQIDGRSDVYSLGCVLYEMLVGEQPHPGRTPQAVITRLLTVPPIPPRMLRETISEHLDRSVRRALARSPADRFAGPREFADAINTGGASAAATVDPDGAGMPGPSPGIRDLPVDPEVYQLYQRGVYHSLSTDANQERALDYLERALAIDPTYAPAHAGRSLVYSMFALHGAIPPSEAFRKAQAAANRALELNGELAEVRSAVGFVKFWFEWDWTATELHLTRAIALDPLGAAAYGQYGMYLAAVGRTDDGLSNAERANQLEPLSPYSNLTLGFLYWFTHRYEESVEQLEKTLELNPVFSWPRVELAWNYASMGKSHEAIAAAESAEKVLKSDRWARASLGWVYARSGHAEKAQATLHDLTRLATAGEYVDPFNFAVIHAGLGDIEQALLWLNQAYHVRSPHMVWLRIAAESGCVLEALADSRGYQSLLERMKFPAVRSQ